MEKQNPKAKLTHEERVKLLKTVIKVLDEYNGLQRPGFGQKEFELVLSHNKYRMPEKKVENPEIANSPLLQQKDKTVEKPIGMDLNLPK